MARTAIGNQQQQQQTHKHARGISLAVASALVLVGLIGTALSGETPFSSSGSLSSGEYNFWNGLAATKTSNGRSLWERFNPPFMEDDEEEKEDSSAAVITGTATANTKANNEVDEEVDEKLILQIAQRLSPKTFTRQPKAKKDDDDKAGQSSHSPGGSNPGATTELIPHQFLHLHHMKTAGTSMDTVIRCGMNRLKKMEPDLDVPYYNIHECSARSYETCLMGETDRGQQCQKKILDSAILSYCAPLQDLDTYGWTTKVDARIEDLQEGEELLPQKVVARDNDFHALTVLRDPVARVWSMYRFRTSACYSCNELLDIYADIDTGASTIQPMCADQLQNHMTRNLLSTSTRNQDALKMDDDQLVAEAVYNLKHVFTMVGLTEQLNNTMDLLGHTFPWLNVTVEGSTDQCNLPHANASPRNNPCPSAASSVPDEATRSAIEKHNQLDVRVYKAAVEHFNLQVKALRYVQNTNKNNDAP